MIINVSARTDIPNYYGDWLFSRLEEGYVLVRNPYSYHQVTRYELNTDVVDSIVLWTKNPAPILDRLEQLKPFHPYFFVTITPYDKEIEKQVPPYQEVIESFHSLCDQLY
ncbi:hypothetical protein lbkm_0496 [Lachnospiraceae bacterium KM106-2]|nr:hypothetical protein lbkm_0496 [Lachnospiraceae bacterium KM106-2]